jgi:hypothetical protein
MDIKECGELKGVFLCVVANKTVYSNLDGDISVSPLCKWNFNNSVCETVSKEIIDNENDYPKEEGSEQGGLSLTVIIIIIAVGVLVLVVIIVVIVVLYKKRVKSQTANTLESTQKRLVEMSSLGSQSLSSASFQSLSSQGSQGLNLGKSVNSVNEYSVGDVIGDYQIKSTVGRGIVSV